MSHEPTGLAIAGDNQAALGALVARGVGGAQLAYLDPPYNTGVHRDHYADRVGRDAWVALLEGTLRALAPLLAPTGIVCVQIDDHELVSAWRVLDAVFGARARLATVVVKMSELSGVKMTHVGSRLPKLKEYLLLYGASPAATLRPLRVPKDEATLAGYLKYYLHVVEDVEAPVETWRPRPLREVLGAVDPQTRRAFQLANAHRVVYRTNNKLLAGLSFSTPCARVVSPTGVEYVWWGGRQMLFLADHTHTFVGDLWTDLSTINLNKEGGVAFRDGKKPEALLARVLALTTAPGDLVLDPYAGSGTTAAVAHKLARDWITVDQGPQLRTHVAARLRAVVEGADLRGVTRAVGWAGGGRFAVCAGEAVATLPASSLPWASTR